MQLYAVKGVLVYKTNYMATLVLSHIIMGTTKYEGKYYHFFLRSGKNRARGRGRETTHIRKGMISHADHYLLLKDMCFWAVTWTNFKSPPIVCLMFRYAVTPVVCSIILVFLANFIRILKCLFRVQECIHF